jgi:hypothetical protein
MWIFIRLMLALIGFAIRTLARGRSPDTAGNYKDTPYTSKIWTAKGQTKGFEIGMPRTTPTWIRLHPESAADRAFKAIGIANEIQTGDATFDAKVYVTCDHPHVATVLAESSELRAAILALFEAGYRKILFDGTYVRAERKCDYTPTTRDLELLHALYVASWKLSDAPPSRLSDRFFWKALVVEGVIWSIAGYAIGAAFEIFITDGDLHIEKGAVWKAGFLVAGVTFGVLLLLIALWMRGSSRGHRVIIESGIVLLLGLPIASAQVVSDTNRTFDDTPAQIAERTFSQCEIREHRGRRGRRSYTYHLHLNAEVENRSAPALPDSIKITRTLCSAANASTNNAVTIAVGDGRWGIRWYRWIRIDETTWKNPI